MNALTATVLRVSQNGTSHESTAEEKPDSTPSKPEHQDPAPEARPDSTKPDAKVADAENKPGQATADSQAELPNTGIKNENKLLFAGISLLALLGLGFLLKNKKEN
ncbi:pullulanase [Streptococcus pneumoniae]|nr:pullulanase [Streptococcus pneumoniae]